MNLLCLDAGNTRLKWGLHDGSVWLAQGIADHLAIPELGHRLPAAPDRILACNVAGATVDARIEALAATLGIPLDRFASQASAGGIINGYDHPERLGADRWAALIGARGLHAGTALVVMAGTATTIDALDADGRFLGGLILPGLDLMRAALARNTANLPDARGAYREFPTNTDDAIVGGALHATLGAIERMATRLCLSPNPDFCCLLSGGAADVLRPHISPPVRHVDHLVLEGLARSFW